MTSATSEARKGALGLMFALSAACGHDEGEQVPPETGTDGPPFELASVPADSVEESTSKRRLEYEDDEDREVLLDSSNLRDRGVSKFEHRIRLSQRSREDFARRFPEAVFPTPEDLAEVEVRWFVKGNGLIVQNPSSRPFRVAAHFSPLSPSNCDESTSWKDLGPSESVMLTASDPLCEYAEGHLWLVDEYGFLADHRVVASTGTQR